MPLTAAGSPLVGGAPAKGAPQPATVKVRVLRAFLIKAEVQKVDTRLDLPRSLALELRSLNKVEFVKDEPAKPKKESSHAQQ